MSERDNDLLSNAAEALEEVARKCTVGIATSTEAGRLDGIGTGTLVLWETTPIILTAQHIFEGAIVDETRFFLPNPTMPKAVDRQTIQALRGLSPEGLRVPVELRYDRFLEDRQLDIAAFLLTKGQAENMPTSQFFELLATSPDTQVRSSFCMGFPHDLAKQTTDGATVTFTSFDWGNRVSDVSWPGFDAALHDAYEFSSAALAAHPRGFSGGARWGRRGNTPAVWHPNPEIVGMVVAYSPQHKLLKTINRSTLVGWLQENI